VDDPGEIVCETPRLILRRLGLGDLDALEPILGDPEVMRFSIFGPETREGTLGFIKSTQRRYDRDGVGQWAVIWKGSGGCAGLCGICTQRIDDAREHEIGYRLARPYWGKGIATEAACASRDYGLGRMKLSRLVAMVEPANAASIRVAEKMGMRLEKDVVFYGKPARLYSLHAGAGQAPLTWPR
jgi:ribosomal-protein-alanine N-acetyltransferase